MYKIAPLKLIMPPGDQSGASSLGYPQLRGAVEQFYSDEYQALDDMFSDDNNLRDDTARVSNNLFPALTLKIVEADSPEDQQAWTDRLTNTSIKQFGRPDEATAQDLIDNELRDLQAMYARHKNELTPLEVATIATYKKLSSGSTKVSTTSSQRALLLHRIKEYLEATYYDGFGVLEELGDVQFLNSDEVAQIYQRMLDRLTKKRWALREWRVARTNSSQMAVNPRRKHVEVGQHLPPLSLLRAKSLFTHEVLVHAQRSVRGLLMATNLAYGLPGYIQAEEGLGSLMEAAIEGRLPHRIADRYIDIALALGFNDNEPFTRKQLFDLAYGRALLRQREEIAPVSDEIMRRAVWQHVNRIYRGTLGNEIVGAITKDIIYYAGYTEMADYLARYKKDDLYRAIDFVLSGKIDPTVAAHRLYMHMRRFNITSPREEQT